MMSCFTFSHASCVCIVTCAKGVFKDGDTDMVQRDAKPNLVTKAGVVCSSTDTKIKCGEGTMPQ